MNINGPAASNFPPVPSGAGEMPTVSEIKTGRKVPDFFGLEIVVTERAIVVDRTGALYLFDPNAGTVKAIAAG